MPASFLHGVETVILSKGPVPIRGVKTAVIAIVGTAAMIDVAEANRTLNTPQQILNDRDAAKYFGEDRPGFTIGQALSAIFAQGDGPICVVVNVLDPALHKTAVVAEAVILGDDDKASLAHLQVLDVEVKKDDGAVTYVLDTDYTLDAGSGVITRIAGGAIPEGQALQVGYSYLDPSKVVAADIIGAVDVAGTRSGLLAFRDCYAKLGYFPKIIIAPGYSSLVSVREAMDSLAGSIRAVVPVDLAAGTTVQNAIAARGVGGNCNTSSKRIIPCYPYVKRYNSALDQDELVPFSQFYAGVLAAKDSANGYWWSPSNTEIKGITGVERQLTAMINDPTSEVNVLNEAGITTIFNSFGTGFRVWGNRSAAFPASTEPTNFVCIQRTSDVLHESIEYSMLQFMDRPINNALIDAVTESVNEFIRTLIGRGALIDGKCWYDSADNPATEVAAGHLVFSLDYMPPTPAERMTFKSSININYLKTLGGN